MAGTSPAIPWGCSSSTGVLRGARRIGRRQVKGQMMADDNTPTDEPDEVGEQHDQATRHADRPNEAEESVLEPSTTDASDDEDGEFEGADRPAVGSSTERERPNLPGPLGEVVLSYRDRDVRVVLDSPTALQVLRMFSWRTQRGLTDSLFGEVPMAFNAWVVFDLDELLAVTWTPHVGGRPHRPAVDPEVAATV